MASTVSRATSITVRDEESKHTLTELGVNAEDIEVTADAVLSVPVTDFGILRCTKRRKDYSLSLS